MDKLALRIDENVENSDFGSWNLELFRRRGDIILTKAADDLCRMSSYFSCPRRDEEKRDSKPSHRVVCPRRRTGPHRNSGVDSK